MLKRYSCGHVTTCGFWKDDFWYQEAGICPRCDAKIPKIKPTARTIIKGNKVLIVTLAVKTA